jgi:flagellar basal-body rod modification protein FlgD
MASSISSLASTAAAASSSAAAPVGSASNPASEQMFLQLLVAQIKNQDPLNPTDGTQFVSQLAQFSELQNVIGIRTDLETSMSTAAAASTTAASTPAATPTTGTTSTAA